MSNERIIAQIETTGMCQGQILDSDKYRDWLMERCEEALNPDEHEWELYASSPSEYQSPRERVT